MAPIPCAKGFGTGVAAAPDAYSVAHDHTLTVSATDGLLANDTDVGSGTLTVTAVNGSSAAVGSALTLPSGGTVTVASDGALTFVESWSREPPSVTLAVEGIVALGGA